MIELYTKPGCTQCVQAKQLLARTGEPFREITIGTDILAEDVRERFPTAKSAPIVVMDGYFIGGFGELAEQVARLNESTQTLLNENA